MSIILSRILSPNNEVFEIIQYLIFLVVIVFLAYYGTSFIAKSYIKGISTKNINIIERYNISTEKAILLVKLAQEYYFIYIDKGYMSVISKVDEESLKFETPDGNKNFGEVFKEATDKIFNKNEYKDKNSEK